MENQNAPQSNHYLALVHELKEIRPPKEGSNAQPSRDVILGIMRIDGQQNKEVIPVRLRVSEKFFSSVSNLKENNVIEFTGFPMNVKITKPGEQEPTVYTYIQAAAAVKLIDQTKKQDYTGNLTRDAEIKPMGETGQKAVFSIAYNREGKPAVYHNIEVSQKFLDSAEHLKQGDLVKVSGYLHADRFFIKDGNSSKEVTKHYVMAGEAVQLLSRKADRAKETSQESTQAQAKQNGKSTAPKAEKQATKAKIKKVSKGMQAGS